MCKLVSLLLLSLLMVALPLPLHSVLLQCRMQLVDGAAKKVCREADCPIECKNGFCYMRCACSAGHRQVDGNCVPICESRCPENAHCQAPNECACDVGYVELMQNDTCTPICREPCGALQYCAAPDTCRCRDGYAASADAAEGCVPNCSRECDPHEQCVAPNRCDCAEGYAREGGVCAPVCDAKYCENAVCIKPDMCTCRDGYVLNFEIGKCEPVA